MTREDYVGYRNNNRHDYLYEFYKENFNKEKYSIFLDIADFFKYFQMWPPNMMVVDEVSQYYDIKFNVIKVWQKPGEIVKFL